MESERTLSVESVGWNALRQWGRWSPVQVRPALLVEFGAVSVVSVESVESVVSVVSRWCRSVVSVVSMEPAGAGAGFCGKPRRQHTLVAFHMEMEDSTTAQEQPAAKQTKRSCSARPNFTERCSVHKAGATLWS